VRPIYLVACVAAAGLLALLAAGGGLTNVANALAGPERAESVLAGVSNVTFGAVRGLVTIASTAGVIMLVMRGRVAAAAGVWSLTAILSIDLWSEARQYWTWSPPASITYASNPAIDSLRAQREPGRVLAVPTARTVRRDVDLEGDGLMIHQVRQVGGYVNLEVGRYDVLIDKPNGERRALDPKVWALLNVRYLYTDLDSVPVAGVRRIVGPVRDAAGSMVSLYRLPGDNPAAWVVPVAVKAPDDQALATILDPRFSPRTAAIFDTAARVPVTSDLTSLPAPLTITAVVTRYDHGHITVALTAPAPAASTLVVSENDYPPAGPPASMDDPRQSVEPIIHCSAWLSLPGVGLSS